MDYKEEIISRISSKQYQPVTAKELEAQIGVSSDMKQTFREDIDSLIESGTIFRSGSGKIGLPGKMGIIPCVLYMNERGYGFASPVGVEKRTRDIYIHADDLKGAMHGDSVMVRKTGTSSSNMNDEGQVVYVFKRANNTIVGTYEQNTGIGFVVSDNKKIIGDILVPQKYTNGAKNKDKVVVKIIRWPQERRAAEGEVVEVLGAMNDPGVDILSIIKAYRIDDDFPRNVLDEAERAAKKAGGTDGRIDYRQLLTVTIDGEDAKDLDDAISIAKNDDNSFMLYVHIADVSHFVREDSNLDTEARKRGTSIYLADRAVPMLPPRLSNDICSLNPDADRLAFSCRMKISSLGDVIEYDFSESIIRSDRRLSYTEVLEFLTGSSKKSPDLMPFGEMLYHMKELALILKEKREKRGSIEFDFDEAVVILDTDGIPLEIRRKKRTIAESIIEEFMIAANETVAENFCNAEIPFLYRVHEVPDKDKLRDVSVFLTIFGHKIRNINNCLPGDINDILKKVKGKNEEHLVNNVLLRAQQKARYSDKNTGHFGLASKYYTHFTSPIRRYPDLYIHRIMKLYLSGELIGKVLDLYENNANEVAEISSMLELRAVEAERESIELKKVEYMQRYKGEVFEGRISNATRFGFFVELENTVEGLVKISDLIDDYYIFNERDYSLVGKRTSRRYRIGDKVNVLLVNANVERKQIDFDIVYKPMAKKKKHKQRKG